MQTSKGKHRLECVCKCGPQAIRYRRQPMSSSTDIKDVVKEKYGQAATRVRTGKPSCCGGGSVASCDPVEHLAAVADRAPQRAVIRFHPTFTVRRKVPAFPKKHFLPPSAVEIQPRLPISILARQCWTSGPAAESTCSCRRVGSDRPEKHTGSI